jgi:hypothetical protein
MIYKIFPGVLFLFFTFYSSKKIFTHSENNKKIEVAIVAKPTFESNVEAIYKSLKKNQFELPNFERKRIDSKRHFDPGRF